MRPEPVTLTAYDADGKVVGRKTVRITYHVEPWTTPSPWPVKTYQWPCAEEGECAST